MAKKRLEVVIAGDAKGAKAAFGDVEKRGGQFSKKLGGIGKAAGKAMALGVAGAAVGIAAVLKTGFDEIRENEVIDAQTAAVLKSTGGAANVTASQIQDYASKLEKATGVEAESIKRGANMLATFTDIRNEVGEGNDIFNQATGIITDMSVALGTDAKKSAIQVGKALNDPIKGVTALTKVGVSFTQQQKDQIKWLTMSGDKLGAQKIILKELNKEFGGSAAAFGDTTAGKIAKLKARFEDMAAGLATGLLPVLDVVSGWFMDVLPKIGNVLSPIFKEVTGGVRAMILAFQFPDDGITSSGFAGRLEGLGITARKVFNGVAQVMRKNVLPVVSKVGHWLGENIPKAVARGRKTFDGLRPKLETVAQKLGTVATFVGRVVAAIAKFVAHNPKPVFAGLAVVIGVALVGALWSMATAMAAAFAPVYLVVGAVALLVGGLVLAYQKVGWFKTAVDAVARFMVEKVWPAIQLVGAWLRDQFAPAVAAAAGWLWDRLAPALEVVGRFLVEKVWPALQVVGGVIRDHVIPQLVAFATFIWTKVLPVVGRIAGQFIETATTIGQKIGEIVMFVVGLPGRISATISTLWQGLMDGITIAKQWVVDRIDELVTFITEAPTRMSSAASGLFDGIKDSFKSVLQWIIDKWNAFEFPSVHVPGTNVDVGGFGLPDIPPIKHAGGIFRAPTAGGEGLALLRDGERVSTPTNHAMRSAERGPAMSTGGDVYVSVKVEGSVRADRDLAATLRNEFISIQKRTGRPVLGTV